MSERELHTTTHTHVCGHTHAHQQTHTHTLRAHSHLACACRLRGIPGSSVEHNTFCVSAHFRNCGADRWQEVVHAVEDVVAGNDELRITRGRKVLEVRPKVCGGPRQGGGGPPDAPGCSMARAVAGGADCEAEC